MPIKVTPESSSEEDSPDEADQMSPSSSVEDDTRPEIPETSALLCPEVLEPRTPPLGIRHTSELSPMKPGNKQPSAPFDLKSSETLDRSSPELWPEMIPGFSSFSSRSVVEREEETQPSGPPEWMKDLNESDLQRLRELGSMNPQELLDEVRGLQNLAYQLGLEETREMTRGKYLNVLTPRPRISRRREDRR